MHSTPRLTIHKNAIKAWMISASLYGLFWFAPTAIYVALAVNYTFDKGLAWHQTIDWLLFAALTIVFAILFGITTFILPKLRWKHWKYDVSDDEIDMLRGIVISKRTLVPINRVQHVDTRQGPIYRKFGLSSVTISTAATTHEIPALDDETAEELRNTISTLVRKVKDDV